MTNFEKKSQPDWRRYEKEKRRLAVTPMTPAQYQEAITRLARECGV